MFSTTQLTGALLPDKTLCFTFDDGPGDTDGDGPGPKTLRLAHYLHDQQIWGTFFSFGPFVEQYPKITSEVSRLGHIVGNHTYRHEHMIPYFKNGGDIVVEITRTDELIASSITNNTVFFRAPYGEWDAELSTYLNERLDKKYNHIGPFHWDITGGDFAFWGRKQNAETCANAYINEIMQKNRGIILMHDSTADYENMRLNNLTFETVQILVPELKRMGYSFVRLDEIPGVLS